MMKRVLSLILVMALVFGCVPNAFAVVNLTNNAAAEQNELEPAVGITEAPAEDAEDAGEETSDVPELTKFESSGRERFSETAAMNRPEADDMVTFIVVVDEKPQLELFSVNEIANHAASVQTHAKKQENVLTAVKNRVQNTFGKEEGFKLGFTYTIATTGFSVTTAYGNKAQLEAMENVAKVYVAPTFNVPEDQDFEQYTNNATTMIGAHTANETGYTGKGMRVAILDTGIKVDHPSFGALPEEALLDPMTRDSVEKVWSELNAGKMAGRFNLSYYNSKLPFVFNYSSGTFDVSNSYAGSDHGTHVAGIIGAVNNNGKGVSSIAGGTGNKDGVRLMSCQIFYGDNGAKGTDQEAATGFIYAADNGACIAQCSWGHTSEILKHDQEYIDSAPLEYAALQYYLDPENSNHSVLKGNIAVFAAGNQGNPYSIYPGALKDIISVTALDCRGLPAGSAGPPGRYCRDRSWLPRDTFPRRSRR